MKEITEKIFCDRCGSRIDSHLSVKLNMSLYKPSDIYYKGQDIELCLDCYDRVIEYIESLGRCNKDLDPKSIFISNPIIDAEFERSMKNETNN